MSALDRIIIRDLRVPTVIGVYDFERTAPQTLRLDVTLFTDITPSAVSDDVAQTLDYGAVASTIQAFGAAASYQLLEAFGEQLCLLLFRQYQTPRVDLVIYKDGCIPGAQGAELHISRTRPTATGGA